MIGPDVYGMPEVLPMYHQFVEQGARRQENAKTTCQAMTIADSSHIDMTDMVLCQQFEGYFINSTGMADHGRKKQGTNMEFQEMLGMLWLQYLYNLGLHDGTFDIMKT